MHHRHTRHLTNRPLKPRLRDSLLRNQQSFVISLRVLLLLVHAAVKEVGFASSGLRKLLTSALGKVEGPERHWTVDLQWQLSFVLLEEAKKHR